MIATNAQSNNVLNITFEDFKNLKKKYKTCKKGEIFIFKGQKILKEYAKYLIEYLEDKF